MNKLQLHIGEMVQGEFSPKKLNLLLMFQVNCPGCFLYALPTFNQLFEKYDAHLGFIALSTAFEDFGLNTQENTELLINESELIGETKKALLQQGHQKLPYELLFPVGMDALLGPNQKEELVENICSLNPNYSVWSTYDQKMLRTRVLNYVNTQEKISLTFTANQFRGTPTIVLFNDQKELIYSWFGHQPIDEIIHKIETSI